MAKPLQRLRGLTLAVVILASMIVWAPPAAASAPPAAMDTARTVTYAGVSVSVPAVWPVLDLAGKTGCVRYDVNAVYLGTPASSDCPAGLVGHVATVQISASGAAPVGAIAKTAHGLRVTGGSAVERDLTVSSPTSSAQVIITAGADSKQASAIADTVTFSSAAPPPAAGGHLAPLQDSVSPNSNAPGTATTPDASAAPTRSVGTVTGAGFDACQAPTVNTMNAWLASPYRTIGVYVGGQNRACSQPNLTASWVTSVHGQGWHLLPIYVGRQAPCNSYSYEITPGQAAAQGTADAIDAAAKMAALGLGAGNPIYFDMENYNTTNAACVSSVKQFIDAWTVQLHAKNYLSGVYGSASSMMTNLVQWGAGIHQPDAIWYARWDGRARTTGDASIPDALWSSHQRVHQFLGPADKTYGGVKINIDSDQVDAPATGALSMTTTTLAGAARGFTYSATLAASGGSTPYVWKVTSGALPSGISLSSSGAISGVPTAIGSSTFTVRATSSTGSGSVTRSLTLAVNYFTDVPAGADFYDDIAWLDLQGITTGYADGTFHPGDFVDRQAMAAFLYRMANPGATAPACTAPPFTDVAVGEQFCPQISWLKGSGISNGYVDGTFHPGDFVDRQAMAAFLYRMANPGATAPACTTPPFTDVAIDTPFCPQISWLEASGITTGYPDGTFHPNDPIQRQAMAAFLHRLSSLSTAG